MIDGPHEPQQISASDRFKAIITSAESATYGLKENLLAVMTRDGSATWQTVAAHIEAQLPGAGEFASARLNAIIALIRTLLTGEWPIGIRRTRNHGIPPFCLIELRLQNDTDCNCRAS